MMPIAATPRANVVSPLKVMDASKARVERPGCIQAVLSLAGTTGVLR